MKVAIVSDSTGLIMKYWQSLNGLGVYSVMPYTGWSDLLDYGQKERYDILILDDQCPKIALKAVLLIFGYFRVAKKIVVISSRKTVNIECLKKWAIRQQTFLIGVIQNPIGDAALSCRLGEYVEQVLS